MKKLLILFLLLLIPLASAKIVDKTLYKNDSYMEDGVNMTLMNINKDVDKFLICINGEQYIVTEDGISRDLFIIKVDDIHKDSVDLKIDVNRNCKIDNCGCKEYCTNRRCFQNEKYIPHEENKSIGPDEINDEVNIEEYVAIILIILLIAIVGVAYYVIKKKLG